MIRERIKEIELGQKEIMGDDRWKDCDVRYWLEWRAKIGKEGLERLDKGKK
jgi:hypothetical protein